MSVLRLDKRRDPSEFLNYAPRRVRAVDDEHSILPVLERLRRGDGGDPAYGEQIVQDAPALDPYAAPAVPLHSPGPFSVIGRIAVAAGIAGGLGFLAVSLYQHQPTASDPAQAQTVAVPQPEPSGLPRKVHTVSFEADHATTSQPAAELANAAADANAGPAATKPEQVQADDAMAEPADKGASVLTAPLTLWATVPPDMPAETAPPIAEAAAGAELKQPPPESQAPAASAEEQTSATPSASATAPPASAAPPAPRQAAGKTRHVRHAHRRHLPHHRWRHRTHVTHPATASAPQPTTTAEAQPSDPISNALRAMFGHPESKTDANPAQ